MNMCEYVNNLISLDITTKQTIERVIYSVGIEEYVYLGISQIYDFPGLPPTYKIVVLPSSYKFRVEKVGHEPVYKIVGRHLENEEYVDEYIKTHGIIPMVLKIGYYYDMDIYVKEPFNLSIFSDKLKKHKNKEVFLRFW
ncbi:hypothetical protein [Desulfurella sp.]|uniref:hypothetical protein n=1 Tax=Desulfurella sp. TaxID=1962857 RepID=UPI0025BA5C46|nr:hypothetical protein [Desulfurella sp.]